MNGGSKLILKLLSFLAAILVGILVYLLTNLDIHIIIIIASVLLIITLILFFHEKIAQFHRLSIIGIKKIEPKKADVISVKPKFLLEADEHIRILGASLKTFWLGSNPFIDYLAQAGKRNVAITILLLNPESKNIEKARDENILIDTYKNRIRDSISQFKAFKQKNRIGRMELYLYDDFPVWHMIIIDRKYAKISYYPYGKVSEGVPYYIFNNQGKYNLLEPFIIYFEKLQERSEKVEL